MILTINLANGPAPTAARRPGQVPVPPGLYAAVTVAGRLSLLDAGTGRFPMSRDAVTGADQLNRIRLDAGIACWLDADQQDGSCEINIAASLSCAALSRQLFTGPTDAPVMRGPAVLTATAAVTIEPAAGRRVSLLPTPAVEAFQSRHHRYIDLAWLAAVPGDGLAPLTGGWRTAAGDRLADVLAFLTTADARLDELPADTGQVAVASPRPEGQLW